MTRRNLFRLLVAVNIFCWGYVALNLKIEEECNAVDKTCTTVRYAIGDVSLWEAPDR